MQKTFVLILLVIVGISSMVFAKDSGKLCDKGKIFLQLKNEGLYYADPEEAALWGMLRLYELDNFGNNQLRTYYMSGKEKCEIGLGKPVITKYGTFIKGSLSFYTTGLFVTVLLKKETKGWRLVSYDNVEGLYCHRYCFERIGVPFEILKMFRYSSVDEYRKEREKIRNSY
jgi:hypothetical protein